MTDLYNDLHDADGRTCSAKQEAAAERLGLKELYDAAVAAELEVSASAKRETVDHGGKPGTVFGPRETEVYDEEALNARDRAWQRYHTALEGIRLYAEHNGLITTIVGV